MCYKIEKQRKIEQKLAKELKDIPDFISDFFDRYKSAATKRVNWIYIRDMLNWMVNNKYINKQSIAEINETEMKKTIEKKSMKLKAGSLKDIYRLLLVIILLNILTN